MEGRLGELSAAAPDTGRARAQLVWNVGSTKFEVVAVAVQGAVSHGDGILLALLRARVASVAVLTVGVEDD